jgi:hypothetical protein
MAIYEKAGMPRRFHSPEQLWDEAVEYFQWCEDNPITNKDGFECPRPFTRQGLVVHVRCSSRTFYNYEKNEDFEDVISDIRNILYEQKFSGAACGIYNANLIKSDLGIADRSEIDHTTMGEKVESGFSFIGVDENTDLDKLNT